LKDQGFTFDYQTIIKSAAALFPQFAEAALIIFDLSAAIFS
jgi:hypothetical protein